MRLDFQHPQTLRTLTASLLHRDFGLRVHLPDGKLVPTLPLRLNYILWLEDVLQSAQPEGVIPPAITGIDIGCGSACIYPLLGARRNNWRMYALESNAESAQHARDNVRVNHMASRIEVVEQQPSATLRIFDTLLLSLTAQNTPAEPTRTATTLPPIAVQPSQRIADFCMCNPPFFADAVGQPANRTGHRPAPRVRLTCSTTTDAQAPAAASADELATAGGELAFIGQLIAESCELGQRVRVYTTMCGHKSSAAAAARLLAERGIQNVGRTAFCQGRTTRWALAWSFDDSVRLAAVPSTGPTWGAARGAPVASSSSSKRKPLVFAIPQLDASLVVHWQRLEAILADIGVQLCDQQHRSADEWLGRVVAANASWANQRRRRRELQRAAAHQQLQQQQQEVSQMDVQTVPAAHDDIEESFYDDEGLQQERDDDEPTAGKKARLTIAGDDAEMAATPPAPATAEAMLCVQLSIRRSGTGSREFTLEMEYLSGSAGRDGAYQLMQFIQNRWK